MSARIKIYVSEGMHNAVRLMAPELGWTIVDEKPNPGYDVMLSPTLYRQHRDGTILFTIDATDAPAELDGQIVSPFIQRHQDGTITVADWGEL